MKNQLHIVLVSLFVTLLCAIVVFQFSEPVSEVQISWVDEEGENETPQLAEEGYLHYIQESIIPHFTCIQHFLPGEKELPSPYLETFSPPPELS